MNRFMTYDDLRIEVIQCTQNPNKIIAIACNLTQRQDVDDDGAATPQLIEYLFTANHTSPFEHVYATFLLMNVSRSFLAQITRHRMGSFTSSSQHYQKYDTYPNVLDPSALSLEGVKDFLDQADEMYRYQIERGIPKEEARQTLPNAKAVNLLWTINARSLLNFFNQRLCKRNVQEMYLFAEELHAVCMEWWPTLFTHAGPDCITLNGCRQGHMKAEVCKDAEIQDFER